jgi:hypothetical protein
MKRADARSWSEEEFGGAELGHARRTARAVAMASECCMSPSGRISDVFVDDAARQGAYDFIESRRCHAGGLLAASQRACALRSCEHPYIFVPLDGTSLSLVDRCGAKDFGAVGTRQKGGRGLKVIDAIGVSPDGTPLGVATLQWWARGPEPRKRARHRRPTDRETTHWLDAVRDVAAMMDRYAPNTKAWFQVDREGDGLHMLTELASSRHLFTVRSNGTRRLVSSGGRKYLRPYIERRAPDGYMHIQVSASPYRSARLAHMAIRFSRVTLQMKDKWHKTTAALPVYVVHVREVRTTPRDEKPLDWILLTNDPVRTLKDAKRVVLGYSQRWRIEDFHKTWKSGVCDVESTQLRARAHVTTWATMLAAVAVRVERIKHLSREQPDRPASDELSPSEIRALILLKRKYKKRTETIPDSVPTMADATKWIAQLGGYTGKSSGGPPGSITIGRGFERLRSAAAVVEMLEPAEKKRRKR